MTVSQATSTPIWELRTGATVEQIAGFSAKWGVAEFSLFGSVMRDDFRPDSEVDVMVTFRPEIQLDISDLLDMREELEGMFHRKVDLVEKKNLHNPFRRHEILTTRQVINRSRATLARCDRRCSKTNQAPRTTGVPPAALY
jgi:predicted nucleotidyltransferase